MNVVSKHIYVCRLSSDVALSVNNSHNRFRDTRIFSRNFRFLFFTAFQGTTVKPCDVRYIRGWGDDPGCLGDKQKPLTKSQYCRVVSGNMLAVRSVRALFGTLCLFHVFRTVQDDIYFCTTLLFCVGCQRVVRCNNYSEYHCVYHFMEKY